MCRLRSDGKDGKESKVTGWSGRSAEPEEFQPGDQIGIVTGWLSDGNREGYSLVCIDLDSAPAVARAPEFLPPTGMIDGRAGKPRSHWWFFVPNDTIPADRVGTKTPGSVSNTAADAAGRHRGPQSAEFEGPDGMIVEFRGSGRQAAVPPSLHVKSDEVRVWEGGSPSEPAVIDYPTLMGCVERLAEACGWKRSEAKQLEAKQPRERKRQPQPASTSPGHPADRRPDETTQNECVGWERYVSAFRGYLLRMLAGPRGLPRTGCGGNDRTVEMVALGLIDFDLPGRVVWDIIAELVNEPLKSVPLLLMGPDGKPVCDADKRPVPDPSGRMVDDSWTVGELVKLFDGKLAERPTAPNRGEKRRDFGWPSPVPFKKVRAIPPFPRGLFPGWMEDYVSGQTEELQVAYDLPAMLALGFSAGGIARKVVVEPRPGWCEPLNLYAMVCLKAAERKSAAFADAIRPIHALQERLQDAAEPSIKIAESQKRLADGRVRELEKAIMNPKTKPDDRKQYEAALDEARAAALKVEVPVRPVLQIDNDTPEKMEDELYQQCGRLLAASPEARGIENITAYRNGACLDVWLKGHAGDTMTRGRQGTGRASIDRPALTAVYSPQPYVVEMMGGIPGAHGRGFLARWFIAMPQSRVGYRDEGKPMPEGVRQVYDDMMTRLWEVNYANPAIEEPHVLRFTPDAYAKLREFERWKEIELRPGGELADVFEGWGGKLGGLCVRLCGILHAMDGIPHGCGWLTELISVGVVERAITLCRYAVQHVKIATDHIGESETVVNARRVLEKIRDRPIPTADFTAKQLNDRLTRSQFPTMKTLAPCLELLEDHFLIRPKGELAGFNRRGPGRKPSPAYEVNPAAFDQDEVGKQPIGRAC